MVYDVDTGNLKMAENFYLLRACEDKSLDDLVQFASFRRIRHRLTVPELMKKEAESESELGLEEFVRIMSRLACGREEFMTEVAVHLKEIRNANNLLKSDIMLRSVGAIICFTLKNIGIDFPEKMPAGQMIHDFIPQKKCAVEKILEKGSVEQ